MQPADVIAVVGLVIGVPSLILAFITIRDCKKLAKHLEILAERAAKQNESAVEQSKRLDEVSRALEAQERRAKDQTLLLDEVGKALTTQYIGNFPDYLPKVTKLVENSKSNLRVMCNVFGHGSFTAPDHWNKTKLALHQAYRRGVDISMLSGNGAIRDQLFNIQYPELLSNWKSVVAQPDAGLTKKIVDFLPRSKNIQTLTRDDFFALIREEDDGIRNDVFRHSKVTESNRFLPLYMWIADDTEAVFAFPTHPENGEVSADGSIARAFLTKDKEIVQSLIQFFDQRERELSELPQPAKTKVQTDATRRYQFEFR